MKKVKLFAIAALTLVATFSAFAADDFKFASDKAVVTVKDLAPNADFSALVTCYDITVAPDAVGECSSLVITPVVKNGDSKKIVEIIVINGSSRKVNKEWLQSKCYSVCDPNFVRFYTMKEGESLKISNCTQIPYEPWMDNGAAFYMTTQKATYKPNCIKNDPGEEYICEVPYLKKPLVVNPVLAAVPVDVADNFSDARVIKTRLYYPVNVTRKVDNYLENEEALAILNTLNQAHFDVASVAIEGWASPESTVAYNNNLSANRAKTVKKIITDKYNFPESVFTTKGNGEYWDSVEEYVATTDEPAVADNRAAIQDAIAANADLDKREAAIKKIAGGKPYKAIFNATYPRSRFADCIVTYEFKKFNNADAKTIYNADPSVLIAEEYVNMLEEEYDANVLAKALELYPDDADLNKIAAEKAYAKGAYDDAINFFKKAGDSAEIANNIACCYLQKADAENAAEYLKKAEELDIAETNANELRKVVLNNKYFAK